MHVVTAHGTILDLSPDKITIHPQYAHEEKSFLMPDDHNDLFFAMRGAGSSFGIATEFLYKIYPTPETSPAVILVWISDKSDLWKIQKAAYYTNKYSITVNDDFDGDFWFQLLQDQDSLQVSSNIADQHQDSTQRRSYSSLPDSHRYSVRGTLNI